MKQNSSICIIVWNISRYSWRFSCRFVYNRRGDIVLFCLSARLPHSHAACWRVAWAKEEPNTSHSGSRSRYMIFSPKSQHCKIQHFSICSLISPKIYVRPSCQIPPTSTVGSWYKFSLRVGHWPWRRSALFEYTSSIHGSNFWPAWSLRCDYRADA